MTTDELKAIRERAEFAKKGYDFHLARIDILALIDYIDALTTALRDGADREYEHKQELVTRLETEYRKRIDTLTTECTRAVEAEAAAKKEVERLHVEVNMRTTA